MKLNLKEFVYPKYWEALELAHSEAKACFRKGINEKSKEYHYNRFVMVCETLGVLGLVEDSVSLAGEIWEFEYNVDKARSE